MTHTAPGSRNPSAMMTPGGGRLVIASTGELFGGVERQILDLCTWYRRTGSEDPKEQPAE